MTKSFATRTAGQPYPGAASNDALISFPVGKYLRPVAGIRDAKMGRGAITGSPLWREDGIRDIFCMAHDTDTPIHLHIAHHTHGEMIGLFTVQECSPDKLTLWRPQGC